MCERKPREGGKEGGREEGREGGREGECVYGCTEMYMSAHMWYTCELLVAGLERLQGGAGS